VMYEWSFSAWAEKVVGALLGAAILLLVLV
jgi:hypothetical protein